MAFKEIYNVGGADETGYAVQQRAGFEVHQLDHVFDGKKSTATAVLYGALDLVAKRVKDRPVLEVFEQAVNNCKPNVEVRSSASAEQLPGADAGEPQAAAVAVVPLDSRRGTGS